MWLPFRRSLLFAKALVVVSLRSKQLLEVRLAVHNSLHGRVVSEGHNHVAVAALEAVLVEHFLALLLLDDCLLSSIYSLVACVALLSVQVSPTEL